MDDQSPDPVTHANQGESKVLDGKKSKELEELEKQVHEHLSGGRRRRRKKSRRKSRKSRKKSRRKRRRTRR